MGREFDPLPGHKSLSAQVERLLHLAFSLLRNCLSLYIVCTANDQNLTTMVNLKTVLDIRRAKSDGTFNILFRLTNYKEVKYLSSGFSVHVGHWDPKNALVNKTHANANSLNTAILNQFFEIQKELVNLDVNYTFEILKRHLCSKPAELPKLVTFENFAERIILEMEKANRTGGAQVYKTAVNRLIDYCGNSNILFKEIDYSFLESFKSQLTEQGLAPNSVGNYLRSIRALYNKAIKAKIISREFYPFNDISIKTEKTAKRAIKADDLVKLYNYPKKPSSQEWHASNYFFLSFALRGISFTDLAYLKASNIKDGCIVYRRRKTKKLYNIKLHSVALSILNEYPNNGNGYLLPIFPKDMLEDGHQSKKITRQWIKTTNKYLNRIAESIGVIGNITTYVVRHSWATLAKKLGYANEMIAEGMGHEYGNKITNIYLDDFDSLLIDEMNDKIILSIISFPL